MSEEDAICECVMKSMTRTLNDSRCQNLEGGSALIVAITKRGRCVQRSSRDAARPVTQVRKAEAVGTAGRMKLVTQTPCFLPSPYLDHHKVPSWKAHPESRDEMQLPSSEDRFMGGKGYHLSCTIPCF